MVHVLEVNIGLERWEEHWLSLKGIAGHEQKKNGALETANKELQEAAELAKAARAQLEERAASFDEMKVNTHAFSLHSDRF